MIHVVLQGRGNLFSKPGGDTTQMVNLKQGLNREGMSARIRTELGPDLTSCQVVHLFNITRVHDTYLQMVNAKAQGKPVICTPIFHDLEEYNRWGRWGAGKMAFRLIRNDRIFEYVRGIHNALRDRREIRPVAVQLGMGYRVQQAAVLKYADQLLFGSLSEKRRLQGRFAEIQSVNRGEIVKLGVPLDPRDFDPAPFEARYGLKDFVLCVGRIEDLKNQWSLLEAMAGFEVPIVLIGPLNRAHMGYGRKVLREISRTDHAHYLGAMGGPMLRSAFAAAKVHVLPSWFETAGLASLEAGLAGCNVVSTNRGYARDYLEDFAWYCDPSEVRSIRKAVGDALSSPRSFRLQRHIQENLRQEDSVRRIARIYHGVLS
jgi:glycosyltransferase involved in cell wall biosynthesis